MKRIHAIYDFKLYNIFKRQSYGDSKSDQCLPGVRELEQWIGRAQRVFRVQKSSACDTGRYISLYICPNPQIHHSDWTLMQTMDFGG